MFSLVITRLPGNKFVNCMIMGGAEMVSVFLSGVLMTMMRDTHVMTISFFIIIGSQCVFIFSGDGASDMLIYIANCFFVGGMGAWQNVGMLVSELRVPPQSLGSVNLIA